MDACVDGHKTTQLDVKDQRREMDKVKHFVEGAIGQQSRMAETLDNKFMTEERERKKLREERQELHCLTVKKADGKTIRELADKKARPSYEKALTKLLRPALSAGGKTLLIVNVSPTVASAHETKESLRFAQDAKKVKLGEASRDVDRA